MVTSLRQDGREVLPSRAADLIAADPARRGVYGGAALLLVFARRVTRVAVFRQQRANVLLEKGHALLVRAILRVRSGNERNKADDARAQQTQRARPHVVDRT